MQKKLFKKRCGTTDRGKDYENLMVANLIIKLLRDDNTKDFNISSNDDRFGDFDDVVLETETTEHKQSFALQLKYSNKTKTLAKSALMEERGNFSINKYFENFENSQNNPSTKLILFTNKKFDVSTDYKLQILNENLNIALTKVTPDPLLNTSSEGRCFKFEIVEDDTKSEKIQQYQKFFEIFFLYTNQASVDDIKDEIMKKFQEIFGCDKDAIIDYLHFINEWSIREGKKNKLDKNFMKKAITILCLSPFIKPFIFADVSNEKSNLLQEAISYSCNVAFFEDQNCNKVRRLYGNVKNKLENSIGLMYQIFCGYCNDIVDLDDGEVAKLLWLTEKCPLIVKASDTVYKTINFFQNGQFIIIEDDMSNRNLNCCRIFENLADLDPDLEITDRILTTFTCSIQEKAQITLKNLVELDEEVRTMITTNVLLQMVENPSLTIGGRKEVLPVPYIDRLLSVIAIDYSFLNEMKDGTSVIISCVPNTEKMKSCLQNHNIITIEDYLENSNDCDIFLSEKMCSQIELEQIYQNNGSKTYHHFKLMDDGNLEWITSKNGIQDLKHYYHPDKYFMEEEKLAKNYSGINIICAGPGMGKTIVMKNIKNNCPPTHWVELLYPKEHFSYFSKRNTDPDDFLDYIFAENYGFDLKMLAIFRKTRRIIFIWDGLDEISEDNFVTVLNIIDQLSQNGFTQWLASRCHLKKTLEDRFGTFSRSVKEFDENQQYEYVKKRLNYTDNPESVTKIKRFIDMHDRSNILGIPLQIYMLTELFRQNQEKYNILFCDMFSMADLYHHFFDEKINFYFKEKEKLDNPQGIIKEMLEKEKQERLVNYEKVALKALFNKENFGDCQEFLNKIHKDGDCFGIITEVIDGQIPNFFHHSFGEYLSANCLVRNYKQIEEFKEIIFDEKYKNVRFLFDLIMAKDCPVHIAILHKNMDILKNCPIVDKDKGGRNPVHLLCSWGEKYPILDMELWTTSLETYFTYNYWIDVDFVKDESVEYKKMLEFAIANYSPWEIDDLFKMNSINYAEKSLCLYPVLVLSKSYKIQMNIDVATVLYYSLKLGFSSVLDSIENIHLKEKEKKQFLYFTLQYNRADYLKKLLKHRSYINMDLDLDCLLYSASKDGLAEVVRVLIENGANVNKNGVKGSTPLHIACNEGHTETARVLIEHGANVNTIDDGGFSPIHLACEKGFVDTVQLLIKSKADVNVIGRCGFTPMHQACKKAFPEIVKLLINSNANINAVDEYGFTPLHRICCRRNFFKVVQLLIEANVNVNAVDEYGLTPLHRACKRGSVKNVKLLIENKANPNIGDRSGETPLHVVCFDGNFKIVQLLVEYNCDLNIVTHSGNTPLYYACQQGHVDIVRLLIERNADVTVINKKGFTAEDIARRKGHAKIVKLLTNRPDC